MVVGFVGRLHDFMKGCLDFPPLIKGLPDYFIGLVAGQGQDEQPMRASSRQLGCERRLIFAGLVENVSMAYHAMDVFCFLSRHEPFGLTIAEAMACMVPVVGYARPGGSGELLNDETGCVIGGRNLRTMTAEIYMRPTVKGPGRVGLRQQRKL